MSRRVSTFLLTALLLASAGDPAHARSQLEIEFAPGVAIPLAPYLVTKGDFFEREVVNSVGFGAQIHIVLDDWELRYAVSMLPVDHVSVSIQPEFFERYNAAIDELGLCPNPNACILEPVQVPAAPIRERAKADPLVIHNVNFGYRIHAMRDLFKLYFPVGLGFSVTESGGDLFERSLYGLSAHAGIGASYDVLPWLVLGGSVRYVFIVSEGTTDLTQLNILANLGVNSKDIESSYNFGHLLQVAATLAVRF
jgi:hypothetical protein